MFKEFQKFILRGNVLDLAVGIIIGAAFTGVVSSLVNDIIMPPIGLLLGGIDFANIFLPLQALPEGVTTLQQAKDAAIPVIAIGAFINTIINLLIVGFAVFMMVRGFNRLSEMTSKKEAEAPAAPAQPTTEEKLVAAIEKLNSVLDKR